MKMNVTDIEINVIKNGNEDYISLTDMIRAKDGDFFIADWLRNRNTLEFLSVWEQLYNPNFNYGEFAIIKNQSGLNSFKISVKDSSEKTNAIGVIAKTGRYGGTYAQKDIAFEFGTWISPVFKLYLIREFQRLKDEESKLINREWDYRRFLSKVNYKIRTDSTKNNLISLSNISKEQEGIIYASEAELLNLALFGITSKEWRMNNSEAVSKEQNIRDFADIPQLTVLANLESHNAEFIRQGILPMERLVKLRELAIIQLKTLHTMKYTYPIESPHITPTGFNTTK
jgi:hypothetical protein